MNQHPGQHAMRPVRFIDSLQAERARSVMLFILSVAALGAILTYAKPVLAPILFALIVGIVVSPVADRLHAMGVPRLIVASSLLIISSGLLILGFLALEPLLSALASRLPAIRAEVQGWIATASDLISGIEALSLELERTVGADAALSDTAPELPTIMDAIWLAPNLGGTVLIFVGTLFFFVLSRSDLYEDAGPLRGALARADRAVARYFAAVTIVNLGLGAMTALVLSVIGLNNAVLWGLAAGILNYVLYLGPLTIFFSLLAAGMLQFGGAMALLPPLAFLTLNITEAQFVTPAFLGQRLEINPLAVFLAIVVGLWMWGPVGAIIALPVTLWVSVLVRASSQRTSPTFVSS